MDNFDDFSDLLGMKKNMNNKCNIYELKLTYNYFNDGDITDKPIKTSIEILEDTTIITNSYNNGESDEIEKINKDNTILLKKLSDMNFLDYKANYFTDLTPEKYEYWEISYNYKFKIVGTFDQRIELWDKLFNLFNFKDIINRIMDGENNAK